MLSQFFYPDSLSPEELDLFLETGWFRNTDMLYRSTMTLLDGDLFSVVRTRLPLEGYTYKKRLRKLLKRNEQHFTYTVQKIRITPEKEALYQQQTHRFQGYVAQTLTDCLFGYTDNVFDTHEICVYEGEKLVAVSFFDIGATSIASLMGLYDHAYLSHSLGLYTMLLEIAYGILNNIQYYYPGYVLPGNTRFDYKHRIGSLEYYNWEGVWRPFIELNKEDLPGDILKTETYHLQKTLMEAGIPFKRILYPLYDVEVATLPNHELLRNPLVIECFPNYYETAILIYYNAQKATFQAGHYRQYMPTFPFFTSFSLEEYYDKSLHFLEIMECVESLGESDSVTALVELLVAI